MTTFGHWPELAPELRAFDGRADIGLHLNLTLGAPLGPWQAGAPGGRFLPFPALARAAFTGRLGADALRGECLRQIEAFAQHFGRLPDFVDGHQHVHVLPGVRAALVSAIETAWQGSRRPWVRDPFDTPGTILARGVAVPKALVIAALSVGLGRTLNRRGIATNHGFSGVSPFDPTRSFADDFARFLSVPGPQHLVMCHPGFVDEELPRLDPVVATRPHEHDFLMGDGYLQTCVDARLHLCRFAAL